MSRRQQVVFCLVTGVILLIPTVSSGQHGRGDYRGGGGPGRGPGGGFDPSFILRRMDRNQNGRLDPDEIDDRARFMIRRFAPDVDLSKPVKIDTISKSVRHNMEKRGRDQGRDRDQKTSSDNGSGIKPLVPGFGEEIELPPIPGFGDLAALFDVETTQSDEKETEDAFRRYDRNRDGLLSRKELREGSWYDNPLEYDQNGDGSLSKMELTLRYAIRRISKRRSSSDNRDRRDPDRRRDEKKEDEDEGELRKSYRFLTARERLPEGTPSWFIEKDTDEDGQISMSEFASQWNDRLADQFLRMDQNSDGILTVPECLADEAEEPPPANSDVAPHDSTSQSESDNRPSKAPEVIPDKYLNYARNMIKKYDSDGNGSLSPSEATKTRHQPSDWNGDGKITAEEYARHLMKQ